MPAVSLRHGTGLGARLNGGTEVAGAPRRVVLDTIVVLDLLLFDEPAARGLRDAVERGAAQWLATPPMRDELVRVLGYPHLLDWVKRRGRAAQAVAADALACFDRSTRLVGPAPAAPLACRDPDDQMFIDLAFAHRAELLSRDRAVLDVWRRLG